MNPAPTGPVPVPEPVVVLDIGGVLASNGLDFARPDPVLDDLDRERLVSAYWKYRDAYDLGGPDAEYWSAVLAEVGERSERPTGTDPLAQHLLARDASQWEMTLPGAPEAVSALAGRGLRLWLLSNAPLPLARTVRSADWSAPFTDAVFSSEVALMKPDPQIYALTADRVGVAPEQLLFFDDRQVNVDAARRAGWRAEVFEGDYPAMLAKVDAHVAGLGAR